MNADRLLAHYERIADAPDAIPRLRRFILDLAVRGKLVPQDPKDEPAAELLRRIAAEKARLVKSGEIRRFLSPSTIEANDLPFSLPAVWRWARLGDVLIKLTDGTHHSPLSGPSGDFRYITAKNIKDNGVSLEDVTYVSRDVHEEIYSRCNPVRGDILYIKDGATTGVVTINDLDEPFSMLSSVALLKLPSCLFNRLIAVFLRSPYFYDQMRGFMKGAAITRVTLTRMAPALMPIPPLAEQHRIVAKVDEFMALCDRLEAAREEREVTRDRLTAATLARLDAPDADTFRDDARFALDALPAITRRSDQTKQLRQTILNLAVRGSLVPQDPSDEPAPELLKRIAVEKARLVKTGKPKKAEAGTDLTGTDHGLQMCHGWAITNLRAVCISITDGDHLPPPKAETGIPFLVIGNVRTQRIDFTGSRFVSSQYYEALDPIRRPERGDLLYTLVGSYGIPVIVRDNQPFCVQRHIGILRPSKFLDVAFLALVMESRLVFDQATGYATGIAQKTVPLSGLRRILIPLPPFAEQQRIAAKVDELMAVCDRLEVCLSKGDDIRSRLLGALFAKALEFSSLEMEAA